MLQATSVLLSFEVEQFIQLRSFPDERFATIIKVEE
jgi:hypothetical protein